jgi:O-antigen/teichoic acid export membrane protein
MLNNILRVIKLVFSKEAKEPLYVGLGNLIASIIGALFYILLAYITTPSIYGEINYYLSLAFITAALSSFALDLSSTVIIAKGNRGFFQESLILTLLISIPASIAVAFTSSNMLIALLIISTRLFSMLTAYILGNKHYYEFFRLSIVNSVSKVALSTVLFFVIGVNGIILGFSIPMLILSVIWLLPIINDRGKGLRFDEVRSNIRLVTSTYSLVVAVALTSFIDKIIIAPVFGYNTLGLYQLGYQFLSFISLIPVSLFQYLLPQEAGGVNRMLIKKLGLVLSFALALTLFIITPYIITILFPKYVDAIDNTRVMILGVIPSAVTAVLTSSLLGKGNSKVILLGSLAYIASLIPLLIILGSKIGLIGLGLSLTIALSVQAIALYILYKKSFNFNGN